jgi:hypothetical protein
MVVDMAGYGLEHALDELPDCPSVSFRDKLHALPP